MTAHSSDPHVALCEDASVLIVTLVRADKMNALTPSMIAALHQIFLSAAKDDEVRCLLLAAEGRGFCAGRDLSSAARDEDAETILDSTINPMLSALYDFPKPTIAAVNGAAMGIGLGLALACDIVYAGESAGFSSPFANLGGALDSGGHYFLPRLIGLQRALELIYTADVIDGSTAVHWGLANRVVPDGVLKSSTKALAIRIAGGPLAAYVGQKELVRRSADLTHKQVLHHEARLQGALSTTPEYAEGIAAFQSKRRPDFRAAAKGNKS